MYPAVPRVVDAAPGGVHCRTVIAAYACDDYWHAGSFCVLLDARAMAEGWHALPVHSRSIPSHRLQQGPEQEPISESSSSSGDMSESPSSEGPPLEPPSGSVEALPSEGGYGSECTPADSATAPAYQAVAPVNSTSGAEEDCAGPDYRVSPGPVAAEPVAAPQSAVENERFLDGAFLILGQDYSPELVHSRLRVGTSEPDALDMANAARAPLSKLVLPCLMVAHPQSLRRVGILVALPTWTPSGALVVFDCTRVCGTVFAIQLPNSLSRADILRAANLSEQDTAEVYLRDLPWPLPQGQRAHLQHGDAVVLVPAVHGHFATVSFAELLASETGWAPAWAPDLPYEDTGWTITDQEHFMFRVAAGRRSFFRADVAARIGVEPHELILHAPDPMIRDHADRGIVSMNVIAAATRPTVSTEVPPPGPLCFVDLRPMLLRLMWWTISDGCIPYEDVQARFSARCPAGHVLCLLDPRRGPLPVRGAIQAQHGDVVVLSFLPWDAVPYGPSDGTDDSGPPPSSGTLQEDDEGDSGSRDTADASCSLATGSAVTSTGVDAGTGGGRRGFPAPGFPVASPFSGSTPCWGMPNVGYLSRCNMWIAGSCTPSSPRMPCLSPLFSSAAVCVGSSLGSCTASQRFRLYWSVPFVVCPLQGVCSLFALSYCCKGSYALLALSCLAHRPRLLTGAWQPGAVGRPMVLVTPLNTLAVPADASSIRRCGIVSRGPLLPVPRPRARALGPKLSSVCSLRCLCPLGTRNLWHPGSGNQESLTS